ncbi:NAD-dependent epimerase/dehydratase family protein [Boseongicola sp. H5]|uniref:NAD-dependent epimerase/dehydratase family protein n=1 Tax=Boseongicola sp. H5 TaxID=2763261 RepID=UPI003369DB8D
MSFKRILVTGADGFIGSHLTEALVRAGYETRAFVMYNSVNSGPVTDLCRSFDYVSCRKGEHRWHHDQPRNFVQKQCGWL